MPTTQTPDVVLAGFLNTEAISGEIRGMLFVLVLVLIGYLIVQVLRGNIKQSVTRLAMVAVAVITVGLAYGLLLDPSASKNVTDTVVNIDPAPNKTS